MVGNQLVQVELWLFVSLVYHFLDHLASIVLSVSSCDKVCNASQFASVPERKLRLHDDDDDDDDEDLIGNSFDHGDKEGIS